MYAIDGIFRDEEDYFTPSPLYQRRHPHRPEPPPGTPDQSPPSSAGGEEPPRGPENR